ncbi:hypothetical protein [Microcoleus sp. T2B6]
MPVPQRVNFIVEQAEKPVLDNGARAQSQSTSNCIGPKYLVK